jgi:hypothetical protein
MTLDNLRGLNMKDALEACDNLDSQSRAQLLNACSQGDHRPKFALRVVEELIMPDDLSAGITGLTSNESHQGTIGDYGEARIYIMKQLARAPSDPKAQRAKAECWNHWFFPEYKNISSVRQRFTRVAIDHGFLDRMHLMQITFFSLNGFFNWKLAQESAHTYTTCGLFVRACRAAAHILEKRDWTTNTPSGTDPCITGPTSVATVSYARRGNREPRSGDIFHIVTPGGTNDHVGIILQHCTDEKGNWLWRTAEGGQGAGYETRLFERQLEFKDGKHWHGERPVEKWIDIEALAKAVG